LGAGRRHHHGGRADGGPGHRLDDRGLDYRGQLTQTQKAERQAQLALGNSRVSEGAALQRTGLIGQRFTSLDRLGEAAGILRGDPVGRKRLPEIRNQAIAALGLTDLRLLREGEVARRNLND
jgi:hypothetical protein